MQNQIIFLNLLGKEEASASSFLFTLASMKYIAIIIYAGLTVLNILKFKVIEKTFIEYGMSWTLSKLLPYITLLLLGFLMARWFKRWIIFKLPVIRRIVFFGVLLLPLIVGFATNRIYEGDFSQAGTEITDGKKLSDFRNSHLTVIAIPGCPFCFESIAKLKILKERNPKMKIKFVVCTKTESISEYKKEAGTAAVVMKANNPETLAEMAEGRFPTFVLVKAGKPVYKWSNDQFGVRALDKLEDEFDEK